MKLKSLIILSNIGIAVYFVTIKYTDHDRITLFPLKNYDQNIATWINSTDPGFDKSLLSDEMQQQRLSMFINHYFGSHSPWNETYINKIFNHSSPDDLKSIEHDL